jgi:hypothetical protein
MSGRLFIPFALLNSFFILFASAAVAVILALIFNLPLATMSGRLNLRLAPNSAKYPSFS